MTKNVALLLKDNNGLLPVGRQNDQDYLEIDGKSDTKVFTRAVQQLKNAT